MQIHTVLTMWIKVTFRSSPAPQPRRGSIHSTLFDGDVDWLYEDADAEFASLKLRQFPHPVRPSSPTPGKMSTPFSSDASSSDLSAPGHSPGCLDVPTRYYRSLRRRFDLHKAQLDGPHDEDDDDDNFAGRRGRVLFIETAPPSTDPNQVPNTKEEVWSVMYPVWPEHGDTMDHPGLVFPALNEQDSEAETIE